MSAGERVPFSKTEFRFATKAEGAVLLAKSDEFVERLSEFDRASRVQTDKAVSKKEYLAFVAKETLDWKKDEIDGIEKTIASARKRLRQAGIRFDLPKEIALIKTTGREEGGAAYTRGTSIVFPQSMVARRGPRFERLLLHELFHVFSRNQDPALRDQLYAVLGFRRIGEVKLPESMRVRGLTNPDAPVIEHALEVEFDGKKRSVVPVLFSKTEKYDNTSPAPFFRYLVFRLMVVEKTGDSWAPALKGGEAQLLDSNKVPDFLRQIGQNTGYVIHPEEVLADNFVMLVIGKKKPTTPRILEDMKKILKAKEAK